MDTPKIISMKDAFGLPPQDGAVPELPGRPPVPQASAAPGVLPEEPPEIPPERVAPRMAVPASNSPPVVTEPVAPEAHEPVAASRAPAVSPDAAPTMADFGRAQSSTGLSPTPVSVQPASEPAPLAPESAQPPAGSPPWVGREPQAPTVAEAVQPVPVYPGVGRPRINSISQSVVSVAPATPVTAPVRPTSLSVSTPAAGKLYDRPELDADRFAEEMAAEKNAPPAQRDVAKEYREAASRDLLPPVVPPRPLTAEEERARARILAQQIHSDNEKLGVFGKFRRMLGLR